MSQRAPNLTSVTTINADGSHRFLHPSDVKGRFTLARRLTALVLIAVYVGLPWIPVKGFPAVFLDVANRRFHFFGFTLVAQDLWLGFFLVTGLAFGLFYVTSLFGRLWCGWTCPYTVFLEHVYRRVERFIDGDAAARKKLDAAPWSFRKVLRRVAKHSIYLALSVAIAHVFLSYFVSIPQLYAWMQGPPSQHLLAFGVVLSLTTGLYFAFAWFREQFCIILCPYGRLQSALTDDHTVVIGYDEKRGEPRGKVGAPGVGDCINCMRCVQVCPTGIDIRNGLQLECIGCAACVDACDAIMAKVGRAPGLVRYDSMQGLSGKRTRYLRTRTLVYTVFALMGLLAAGAALYSLKPVRVLAKRIPGQPFFVSEGTVRNQFTIRIINKQHGPALFRVELDNADAPEGMSLLGAESAVEVPSLDEVEKTVILTIPQKQYQGSQRVRINIHETGNGVKLSQEVEFLGPDLRFSTLPPSSSP
ncbi:cytochrome c oxidase accessory protein FixG [Roseimicrobium gellanilyticum]|uniref:Cytochrome c oxidase accessory protein FixG n=1 Tax=Roseimicrobium gellanilyticum TaxID=748857 RepID=A0A366HS06_9BACT|nr:cytochrome c oxidase accessory protein CcoG [Roseimicrobium gellanilyticum]RBP46465.1 cytochrome c oxidase accessory protein FixG [Roseimicrobium gellanilyticum]